MATPVSRRRFLRSAAVLAAGAVVAACGATPTPAPQPTKPAAAAATAPAAVPATAVDTGPLRILWAAQVALVKYFENYTTTVFGPKNNGAKVSIEQVPATAEFAQKLLSGVAAGNPPDIFREVNYQNFVMYSNQGIIMPLDDLIARDGMSKFLGEFLPGSLDMGKFKGKQYCITFGAHPSSRFVFHNKTALAKKGIQLTDRAWKWADYQSYVKTMSDPANKVYGSWLRLNTEGIVVGLRSLGTDVIDSAGTKALINSPEARPFFQMAYNLITADKATPPPTEITDWKPPFAAQKIIMANDNGYRESFLRDMVKDFEWDTFVTPNEGSKPRGVYVGDFAAITTFSKHKELAWQWAKGLLDIAEGVKRVKEAQHIPLPHPQALLPPTETFSPQYTFYIKDWIAEPPLPFPNPANGRTTEMTALLDTGFDAAWLKSDTLDNVLKKVNDSIQAVLDKPPV
jgi:maltose-binding protein MalE